VDVTEGLDLLNDVQIREKVGTGVPIFFFVSQAGGGSVPILDRGK
jgi:hypothetical protein